MRQVIADLLVAVLLLVGCLMIGTGITALIAAVL